MNTTLQKNPATSSSCKFHFPYATLFNFNSNFPVCSPLDRRKVNVLKAFTRNCRRIRILEVSKPHPSHTDFQKLHFITVLRLFSFQFDILKNRFGTPGRCHTSCRLETGQQFFSVCNDFHGDNVFLWVSKWFKLFFGGPEQLLLSSL